MLAAYAVRVENSRGRRHPEPQHPYRNDFQRDRDRVIHSRSFRRLEAKTQVFTRRYSDHFRNRLTHTIEVAQIARTVAAQLGLNVDLVEALALVHDVGHPPFGHAGEKALDAAMRRHGSFFDHNLHALRIVEDFELRYAAFRGLNLTFEVRKGIDKLKFNEALKRMLNRLVGDLICNTQEQIRTAGIRDLKDVRAYPDRLARLSREVEEERLAAKQFLYSNLYFSATLDPEKNDAERVITELFEFWMKKPETLPSSYRNKAKQEPLPRVICDYTAGM